MRMLLVGLVSLLAVQCLGFLWHRELYIGVDGALAVTQIRDSAVWSSDPVRSQISHLQGMGAQQLPLNPWINPGYAILLAGASLPLLVGSHLVFSAALFLAVFGLGTVLRIGPLRSLLAAQGACLLLFQPLVVSSGLYAQLRLNPGVIYYDAIALVLLCLLIGAGSRATALNLLLLAAPTLLFLYSLLCDPVWTIVPYLSLWPFFAAALLMDRTRKADLWRGGAVLFGLAVLALLSIPSYLWTLLHYTARAQFRTEIVGEVQDRLFTFLPFQNARTAALFVLLLAGVLSALLLARQRRVRLFAAACLAHMALMTGLSLVYLFVDLNWTYPLPAYLQLPALPVYLLVATAGWHAGALRALERRPDLQHRLARLAHGPVLAACLVPLAGLALITAKAAAEHKPVSDITKAETDYSGGFRSDNRYLTYLEGRISLRPGQEFRGSLAAVYPKKDAEIASWLLARASAMSIPALEEYSQLVSPQLYYLVTRGLGKPADGPSSRNRVRVTVPRPRLLRAMGVRYVWSWPGTDALLAKAPDCRLLFDWGLTGHRLYELTDPNLGAYSPVHVLLSRSARETVKLILAPELDFKRDVVLTEPVTGPLVPAREAALRFVKGGVRVTASSEGRSILLLPIQFSHALSARATRGSANLVRANLAQTGLVFDREVDALLTLEFGLGQTGGMTRNIADSIALGIREDGSRRLTPEHHDRLHPFAKIRL